MTSETSALPSYRIMHIMEVFSSTAYCLWENISEIWCCTKVPFRGTLSIHRSIIWCHRDSSKHAWCTKLYHVNKAWLSFIRSDVKYVSAAEYGEAIFNIVSYNKTLDVYMLCIEKNLKKYNSQSFFSLSLGVVILSKH